jgi:hypothetical protein
MRYLVSGKVVPANPTVAADHREARGSEHAAAVPGPVGGQA